MRVGEEYGVRGRRGTKQCDDDGQNKRMNENKDTFL